MITEDQLIPFTTSAIPEGPWIVFSPHPDDETFGMGGSLALASQQGIKVTLVVLTDGALGGECKDNDLIALRQNEARKAADILGIGSVQFWNQPDRGITLTDELISKVSDLIKETNPQSVFFPSPMELHPDHRFTCKLAWRGMQQAKENCTAFSYEISVQGQTNMLIDITPVIEEKKRAIHCYSSQINENNYQDVILAINKSRTYTLPDDVGFAEGLFRYSGEYDVNPGIHTLRSLRPYWIDQRDGMQPLVSVIVRTRDRANMLRNALDSVVSQSYPNLELIVVNDAGADVGELVAESGNALASYKYINLEENIGRSAAANKGMDAAAGEYLILLDDDDWFLSDHIQTLVDSIVNNGGDVAYAGVEAGRYDDEDKWEVCHVFNEPYDAGRLLIENYIPMHAAMFRKNLIDESTRFDEQLDIYEDWDFWLKLANKTEFVHVDTISAVYRLSAESGFGVTGSDTRVQEATQKFFNKWRTIWSDSQLEQIVSYSKHRIDTVVSNAESEAISYRQQILLKDAEIEKRGHVISESTLEIHRLEEEAHKQEQEMDNNEKEWMLKLEQANTTISEIYSSHSWKVTVPLRKTSILTRYIVQRTGYFLTVARQLYKQGGAKLLISESRAKLYRIITRKPKFVPSVNPDKYFIEKSWEPLVLKTHETPCVSVIIPVYNKHLYTYTCIKSIANAKTSIEYEVIVVNDHSTDETSLMLESMQGVQEINNTGERGFIHSCNTGADNAKGEYILILNNDTIVQDGWLDTLLNTFTLYPDAGLVGVRLIYPDGILQEAGGIIWADGSGWNYGRHDDPDKPQYNYVRDVDYCSGACLICPRELFYRVGMFDKLYSPAYYEDTDLAFKIREEGMRVLYQPGVTVVHFEGVSSGVDTSSGHKQYQLVNKGKFFQRWGDKLVHNGSPGVFPDLEKDRVCKKRILVIDAAMIRPDQDSGSLRMFNMLSIMNELHMKVTFAASSLEYLQPYVAEMQALGIEVLYTPYISSIQSYLEEKGRDFDFVMLSRAYTAQKHLADVKRFAPHARVLFDTVDLHFLREQRMAELENDPGLTELAQERKEEELGYANISDTTLVVSHIEKEILEKEDPDIQVEILSNIHDIYGSKNEFEKRNGLMFIGSFAHPPNVDAALFLIEEVLPLVHKELGDVITYIVGNQPPKEITRLETDNIKVTGFVEDISGYFNNCRLSVAPIRYGAGVKGKINMSMSYGLPVVGTPIAVEGMHLEGGHDVIIGESAQELAEGIIEVYSDAQLWETLSNNGLQNVEQHFSRHAGKEKLQSILGL